MVLALVVLAVAAVTLARWGAGRPEVPGEVPGAVTGGGAAAGAEGGVGATTETSARPRAQLVPRVPKPPVVRGIYLNAWTAGSERRLTELIALADQTEINTFVIDIKEGGEVSYRSSVRLAQEIGATTDYIPDIRRVLARLREHGIYPIARIVVFKDPVLARARPEWAVQHVNGGIWRDHHGDVWVDSFNRDVWDYNIALAREAIELGFSEVQWDYVRFPDVPRRYLTTAVWPAQGGRSKEEAIREFLRYSREQLADLGVPVTADVFGLTASAGDDLGIGQRWELLIDVADVLLPMVYPSHFARGSYGIRYPNGRPYETVRTALEHAVRRSKRVSGAGAIRPWLQDFSLGPPRYGPAEVRAQIRAVYDAGIQEWILWNPASRYTAAALAPEGGEPPVFPLPAYDGPPAQPQRPETPARPGIKLLGVPVEEAAGRGR